MKVQVSDDVAGQVLALQGGPKAVTDIAKQKELFHWPIVTEEDEQAVLEVLRAGTMSDDSITKQFEAEYARYNRRNFALSYPNGTLALQVAMWAAGLREGDEMICPSVTYWASAMPAITLGASVVFADCEADSLCIDPDDIERHIGPRTKVILVVHYCGHPVDMDRIQPIADKHGLTVIEDVSHAHGTLYQGRMTGTFGRVAAMSMMAAKSFPIGEGGMLISDDPDIIQNALAFAHYRRHDKLTRADLKPFAEIPLGGIKGRLNQTCAAMGRVQLKYYPQRITAIQDAINRFWDLLEGEPGLRSHRPDPEFGSTMGGWYSPLGHYVPEELGGLPVEKFAAAVQAEGSVSSPGCNSPLHLHPVFNDAVIYQHDGQPTCIAHSDRDVRQGPGSLPVSEQVMQRTLHIPYFKHDWPEQVAQHAAAYRKVARQAEKLL